MATNEQILEDVFQVMFSISPEWLATPGSEGHGALHSYMKVLLNDVYFTRRPMAGHTPLSILSRGPELLYVYAKESADNAP